jgi:hypothetical protein
VLGATFAGELWDVIDTCAACQMIHWWARPLHPRTEALSLS